MLPKSLIEEKISQIKKKKKNRRRRKINKKQERQHKASYKIKKQIDFKLIGQNLETIRKENKITQKELAKIMGVSEATYVNYKNGETPIQTEILKKFAIYFNVSLDWLVGKSKNKKPRED